MFYLHNKCEIKVIKTVGWENLKGRNNLGNLGADFRMALK
jgi:hypothetical protein